MVPQIYPKISKYLTYKQTSCLFAGKYYEKFAQQVGTIKIIKKCYDRQDHI